MGTIDHVTLRVNDLDASRALYAKVFELLTLEGEPREAGEFFEWGDFSIAAADAERPATERLHIAFTADSHELVDSWWRALTEAGYRSDGEPGLRPQYSADYYGAFILDAQGNSIEAVTHDTARERPTGRIDHLWIRVEDLEPIKRFYTAVAPIIGLRVRDRGDRLGVIPEEGSFSLLEGPPTRNLHLAIGVSERETVDAFHETALAAGGRDNGRPGERAHYHAGYYGAFVFDPGGTNVEAVFHDRSSD